MVTLLASKDVCLSGHYIIALLSNFSLDIWIPLH